jgi:hypothetical protein
MLNFFIILPLFIFIILFFLPTYTSNQVVVAVTVREIKMDYFYLLTSKNFIFEKEPIEEIFRERINYYSSYNRTVDFWILNSIETLKNKFFSKELKGVKNLENYVFIISTNQNFIDWLHLRFRNSLKYYRYLKNVNPFGKENLKI